MICLFIKRKIFAIETDQITPNKEVIAPKRKRHEITLPAGLRRSLIFEPLPKRAAAPTKLTEQSLKNKMRQPDSMSQKKKSRKTTKQNTATPRKSGKCSKLQKNIPASPTVKVPPTPSSKKTQPPKVKCTPTKTNATTKSNMKVTKQTEAAPNKVSFS